LIERVDRNLDRVRLDGLRPSSAKAENREVLRRTLRERKADLLKAPAVFGFRVKSSKFDRDSGASYSLP
jgi:hypothetical protein